MNEKRDFLINSLKKAANHFEAETLTMSQYIRYKSNYSPEAPSLQTIARYLGKWNDALEVAGLKQQKKRPIRCSRCGNRYDPSLYEKYCKQCESEPARKNTKQPENKKYTSVEIINALRVAGSKINGPVTILAYEMLNCYPSASTIRNHFGSWSEALKKAGIYENYRVYTPKRHKFSDEFLLQHLQNIFDQLGKSDLRAVAYAEVCSSPAFSTYAKRFGSWNRALELAGINESSSIELTFS
jgi:hypothetical protein